MTQEEKAKAYDEALKKAKSFQEKFGGDYAGYIFPELKESEDELIRKRLINLIKELAANKDAIPTEGYFVDGQDKKYIAYLERQKDKMTAKEFENSDLFQLKLKTQYANGYQDGLAQKEQKTAEWSEEDEKCLNELIHFFESMLNYLATEERHNENRKWLEFLKSLRPQSHWKPTFEQMQALNEAKNEFEGSSDWDSLDSLYDDLQKLL